MMMVMMAMAAMTAKDHVPKSQGSKQTQHFVFLHFGRSVCTGHSVRVQDTGSGDRNTGSKLKNTLCYFSNQKEP